MLLAKTDRSSLHGENTIISPCFHIYFLLTWITVIDILVSLTLLERSRAERVSDYLPHCPSLSSMVVCGKDTEQAWGDGVPLQPLFLSFPFPLALLKWPLTNQYLVL